MSLPTMPKLGSIGPAAYTKRELHRHAVRGLAQATLVAAVTMPLGWLTEWLLRDLGFGSANLSEAAMRVGLLVALMVALHVYVRVRGDDVRHPFVIGTFLMWAVGLLGGMSAAATGGHQSPYAVAAVPILVVWTLLMPGGARYAIAPIAGGLCVYESTLFLLSPPSANLGATIATTFFQLASGAIALLFCEVIERWRVHATVVSVTDALTGLMARRYLFERMQQLTALRARKPQAVAVILIDVDHFKRVNDTRGHAVGDEVLKRVAEIAMSVTRREDLCGRLGGEEFLLVLDECDEHNARAVAERLREQVANAQIQTRNGPLTVTLSAGIAAARPGELHDIEAMIRAADVALYEAKNAGRNQVCMAPLSSATTH